MSKKKMETMAERVKALEITNHALRRHQSETRVMSDLAKINRKSRLEKIPSRMLIQVKEKV